MTLPHADDLADTGKPIHAQPKLVEKPPWAAFCWTDEDSLWVELPCPVGKAPVVVQYPKSEGGYAKAMSLVEQCANIKRTAPPPGWFKHIETTRVVNASRKTHAQAKPGHHTEDSAKLQESLVNLLKRKGWLDK